MKSDIVLLFKQIEKNPYTGHLLSNARIETLLTVVFVNNQLLDSPLPSSHRMELNVYSSFVRPSVSPSVRRSVSLSVCQSAKNLNPLTT